MNKFISIFTDQAGATAIEYALIAALIGVAIVSSTQAVGTGIAVKFNTIGAKVKNP